MHISQDIHLSELTLSRSPVQYQYAPMSDGWCSLRQAQNAGCVIKWSSSSSKSAARTKVKRSAGALTTIYNISVEPCRLNFIAPTRTRTPQHSVRIRRKFSPGAGQRSNTKSHTGDGFTIQYTTPRIAVGRQIESHRTRKCIH